MPLLTPTNNRSWTNRHETFTQDIDNLFNVSNPNTGSVLNDYNTTTLTIKQLLTAGLEQGKSVRALGGGWSFTKVATTDGWMVDTKRLNMAMNIRESSVSSAYLGDKSQLLLAQCGMSVQELNNVLEGSGRALKTCGASNGQTIVGAFSTGTHGSAIDLGATQDFIVGLHVIVSPAHDIWLERASYPVVSDAFVAKLNTTLVRDDELFEAVVVGLGSMGFIHSVMLETEPKYLLECYRIPVDLDNSLKHIMQTLDFSGVSQLPHGSERPFHFQVVIDPFDNAAKSIVTVMYKRSYTSDYEKPQVDDPGAAGPGDDVPAFLGKITDSIPFLTPLIVSQLVKRSYKLYRNIRGTCGEIFTNNNIRGKVLSTALGIPVEFALQVNDILMEVNRSDGPFTGIFSYRYTRKSGATLAFTRFDHTLVLELDGVESAITRRFYDVVWQALEDAGIPYTFHWGKINNLDAEKTRRMYGNDLDRWLSARNELLPPEMRDVFSNDTLRDWGLDS